LLYAETKGAAVLAWGEFSKPEQRKAVADLKAACPSRSPRATSPEPDRHRVAA